jgi:broad specificity phosphatase PhoE
MEIVFETHSLTVDNELGVATGWQGGELSSEGRRLAAELGERYRDSPPSAVFTSDLKRAVETAEIAFGATTIPIHVDRRLRECDYGEMTGMSVDRHAAERPHRVGTPFPGAESYLHVVERVRGFLTDVAQNSHHRSVVVIGHTATKWAFDYLILGVPLESSLAGPFEWRPGWRYTLP